MTSLKQLAAMDNKIAELETKLGIAMAGLHRAGLELRSASQRFNEAGNQNMRWAMDDAEREVNRMLAKVRNYNKGA